VFIALITTIVTASQASTIDHETISVSVVQHQTATPKGPALVKARIPKPKLFRSNPHRKVHFLLIDDNTDVFVQDEDLATGYRRRDLTKIEHEDGISEYVRWRLFLARQLALLKYKEVQGQLA
jgi:hypothetical protein